jgi:hypothetical protein
MENDKLNMALRSKVLECALNVEELVMKVIARCLSVTHPNPKALTHKSSSLSFKNKIDLLFDIEMINKEQHEALLLLMEFRNQFMHNAECSSFTIAVDLLSGKGKKLLEYDITQSEPDLETRYFISYKNLHVYCFKTIDSIYDKILENLESQAELLNDAKSNVKLLIGIQKNILFPLYKMCIPSDTDSEELSSFKLEVVNLARNEFQLLMESSPT